jgi:predicted ATPase/DNA-binding SARP family transcriptional activator
LNPVYGCAVVDRGRPVLEFRVLGPLQVAKEGRLLPLGGLKQRGLLALLLLNRNRVVPRDRLVDVLWGESPPASAANAVQIYVSKLRRLLGDDETVEAGAIVTEPPGYRLRVLPGELDADRFERLIAEGREALGAGKAEQAEKRLAHALTLWHGPPLADFAAEPFAQAEIGRLEQLRLRALEERIEAQLSLGRHAEVSAELPTLIDQHPLEERLRAQLMVALYRSGRQADALAAYRDFRRLLADELGLDPSPDLREIERRILRQDSALVAPAAPHRKAELPPAASADFAPPVAAKQTNLPVPPTPLIGREQELQAAGQLLSAHRLITLTGPGGSGKTRLALQLAADAVEDFPDGVVWVSLQALRDPELVLPTIARAMGTGETLIEDGSERRLLLVLDNFEQLLASASKVGILLAQHPRLKLLVTSREPLHLGAEYEFPVAPLREREAVALFIERASAAQPDFSDDGPVMEICRRLDCLPLALELAAARVKVLSAAELLKRLDRRLPILTGGSRDAPERQRTLRATIAWSYELLAPNEQRAFARLAVFAGGCTLEAAEEACQAGLDTVAALIDKNLLRREGDRYFMLETIGEYALERLEESGELEELKQRHADYYLEQARSVELLIRSPQAAGAIDRLEPEHDNLRAALGWLSGRTSEQPLRLAMWGLAARLHGFGDQALDRRDVSEASRLYRESIEIGLQLKDDTQTAYCLAGLAAVGAQRGRLDQAARLWGSITAFERASGAPLHDAERQRYERVLGELEHGPDTSADFAAGTAITLEEAVEYALANVE